MNTVIGFTTSYNYNPPYHSNFVSPSSKVRIDKLRYVHFRYLNFRVFASDYVIFVRRQASGASKETLVRLSNNWKKITRDRHVVYKHQLVARTTTNCGMILKRKQAVATRVETFILRRVLRTQARTRLVKCCWLKSDMRTAKNREKIASDSDLVIYLVLVERQSQIMLVCMESICNVCSLKYYLEII